MTISDLWKRPTNPLYEVRRHGGEIVEISEAGDRRDARVLRLGDMGAIRRSGRVIQGPITEILDPEYAQGSRVIRIGDREWAEFNEVE